MEVGECMSVGQLLSGRCRARKQFRRFESLAYGIQMLDMVFETQYSRGLGFEHVGCVCSRESSVDMAQLWSVDNEGTSLVLT